jgi:hypothetical protein
MILRKLGEVLKYKRNLALQKCYSTNMIISKIVNSNLSFKKLHTSSRVCKNFKEKIEFARNALINVENYDLVSLKSRDDVDLTQAEFLIEKDWTNMSNTDILNNFEILSYYALKNNELFYDTKYERIVEVLSSQSPTFSNKELLDLLRYLNLWNNANNKEKNTNFWNIINQEFFARKSIWTVDDLFFINNNICAIKKLNSLSFSTYSIKKLARKHNILSKEQLVQLLLYLTILPKLPINMYNIEHHFELIIDNLSINEIVIVSMAFNKYKNSIKSLDLNEKILQKIFDQFFIIDYDFLPGMLNMLR